MAPDFQILCGQIIGGEKKSEGRPFYEQVRAFIEAYPLGFQEELMEQICYTAILADDFLEFAAEGFHEQEKNTFATVLDICELREVYRRICFLIGLISAGDDRQPDGSLTFRDMETLKLVF